MQALAHVLCKGGVFLDSDPIRSPMVEPGDLSTTAMGRLLSRHSNRRSPLDSCLLLS
jgi:hypothetical protein